MPLAFSIKPTVLYLKEQNKPPPPLSSCYEGGPKRPKPFLCQPVIPIIQINTHFGY